MTKPVGTQSAKPAIKEEKRYRYRRPFGDHGVIRVDALVLKRNGWYVIGFDRTNKRSVECRPGQLFPMNTGLTEVQYGKPYKWPVEQLQAAPRAHGAGQRAGGKGEE